MSKYVFYELPSLPSGYVLNPERSFFSIIIPEETTNLIYNPEVLDLTYYGVSGGSILLDSSEQHYGRNSIAADLVNGDYVYCEIVPPLLPDEPYTASLSIKGSGTVELYIDDGIGNSITAIETINSTDFWHRWSLTFYIASPATHRIVVRAKGAFIGNLDAFQLEQKPYPTTFCSGRLSGLVINESPPPYCWLDAPNNSASFRSKQTRDGGKIVPLHELGLQVTNYEGLTLPEFENISSPFALRYGSYYYGSTVEARDFEICGRLTNCDLRDYLCYRGTLARSIQPNLTIIPQPIKILYQVYNCETPICQTMEVLAVYKSGLTGNIDNLLGEEICIEFEIFDPYFKVTGNRASDLTETIEVDPADSPVEQENGSWSELSGFPVSNPHIMGVGPDGLVYCGVQGFAFPGTPEMVYQWDGASWNLIGETNSGSGSIYAMHSDGSEYLYVVGEFDAIGNINGFVAASDYGAIPGPYTNQTLGVARYNPATNTWEAFGRFLSTTQPVVYDIEITNLISIYMVGDWQAVEDSGGVIANSACGAFFIRGINLWFGMNAAFSAMTPGTDFFRAVKQVSNIENQDDPFELWIGGTFFLAAAGADGEDLENILRWESDTPFDLHAPVSATDEANLIGGEVYAIEADNTVYPPKIFVGGTFTASNYYDNYSVNYPPDVFVLDSGMYGVMIISLTAFTLVEYSYNIPAYSFGWKQLGMAGFVSGNYGEVYDLKLDSNKRLHVVGDFDFIARSFPNLDWVSIPPAGVTWTVLEALVTQTANCRSYGIWDTNIEQWIVPNILFDDGAIYSVEIVENACSPEFDTALIQPINTGNIPTVYLGFPETATSWVALNPVTIDTECSDPTKPIIYVYGPGTIYAIENLSTNTSIKFDYLTLLPNEIMTINLTKPTFTIISNQRGDLRSYVLPNSSLSSFYLNTGENILFIRTNQFNEEIDPGYVTYRPQFLSIETGCECECN